MASVLPPPSATTKLDATLEQELGKATGRIRLNDLLAGGLALAVLTLAFVAAAILLDRWLVLPAWVRQVLLGGFVLVFAAVGYLSLLRPLKRAVNPRFAARRVEETIPEAKNAIINWVDLHDKDLPAGVRAAVGTKAVEGVAGADVNKAVESKRVVWLAAATGLLLAVLAALFVAFKPAPFLSLVSRTFNPFSGTRIASRTELKIQEPQDGDVTVTAGDPVTVRVYVGGSVPDPDGPVRVRLRVRYNPAVPAYDELPLEPGGSAREWVLRVPQTVVQNGFWYTVAGGDAETTEHRVTVRSRPLFTDEFEARYVHPAYTRLKPEVARDRALWGYAGTEVTLTAKTNRRVKRAWLQTDGQSDTVPGLAVGEARDSIQFKLTLKQPGAYRMGFTSATMSRVNRHLRTRSRSQPTWLQRCRSPRPSKRRSVYRRTACSQ